MCIYCLLSMCARKEGQNASIVRGVILCRQDCQPNLFPAAAFCAPQWRRGRQVCSTQQPEQHTQHPGGPAGAGPSASQSVAQKEAVPGA